MKLSLPISIVALTISAASLFFTLNQASPQITDAELDRLVDGALAKKEKKYVQAMASNMDAIYKDMLGPRYTTPQETPETLGELFTPAIQIINGMTSGQ